MPLTNQPTPVATATGLAVLLAFAPRAAAQEAPVKAESNPSGKLIGRHQCDQTAHALKSENDAQCSTYRAEQQTLGEKLADDSHVGSAQRGTNTHLARPC